MRTLFSIGLIASAFVMAPGIRATPPQDKEPLRLVQKIALPNVKGRIDHIDVDVKGKRLFVAGLENGTLEVVDLKDGKWMRSIPGFKAPQGIAYIPSVNKVFVASNDDGVVRVFAEIISSCSTPSNWTSAQTASRTIRTPDCCTLATAERSPNKDKGEVGIIDVKTNKHVGDIDVGLRAAEILMDKSGQTLFVFDNIASKIQVIDTKKRTMVSAWQVSSQRPGDGAFDEANHRLLIGTRMPPTMTVMDSTTGKEVASLPPSKEWTQSTTMRCTNGCTYRAAGIRTWATSSSTSSRMQITIRKSQRLPRDHSRHLFWCRTEPLLRCRRSR